jgi:hypothetical protein
VKPPDEVTATTVSSQSAVRSVAKTDRRHDVDVVDQRARLGVSANSVALPELSDRHCGLTKAAAIRSRAVGERDRSCS